MLPKFKHKQLKFNEGDLIYSIGDEAKNVYLIHSGHISIRSKHGLELGNLGPGEIFGEVIWRNDDITGIAVNIAARALEKCQSNEVIITKNLKDLLGRTKFSVISMGDFTLKGLEGNWELFKVENSE